MPIISAAPVESNSYRFTITIGCGRVENIVITQNGRYDVHYVKNGKAIINTGRIIKVFKNELTPKQSYILFDSSRDASSRKERIHFCQIQNIIDVTPNDAYKIALEHGFVGTVLDWLNSLHGDPGKSAYEIAVECGFEGTKEEWVNTIQGERGFSAYEIAVRNGFEGSEEEWLVTLKGDKGESAYETAVRLGFEGTEEEWLETLRGMSAYEIAVKYGFTGTEEDWMAQNGDVTAIKQQVDKVMISLNWKNQMS